MGWASMQTFTGDLRLFVHVRALVLDGGFVRPTRRRRQNRYVALPMAKRLFARAAQRVVSGCDGPLDGGREPWTTLPATRALRLVGNFG